MTRLGWERGGISKDGGRAGDSSGAATLRATGSRPWANGVRRPPCENGVDPLPLEERIPRSRHAVLVLLALLVAWRPSAAAPPPLDTVRVGLMSLEAPRGQRRALEALA